jgi:hypothetical protein
MRGIRFGGILFAAAATFLAAAPCRADLFAAIPQDNEVLRIDTVTGNIIDTIEIPDWIVMSQPTTTGLAYDSRQFLTLNIRRGDFDELWHYDVQADSGWMPGGPLFSFDHPADNTPSITGMGIRSDEFGYNQLVAVSRRDPSYPSMIMKYQMPPFPWPFDPVVPIGPSLPLPPNFAPWSADVDPITGELWIGGDEIINGINVPRLVRADMTTGDILQTFTPTNSASPIRGVGFDAGALFIGLRNSPSRANEIYEIDRATVAVLRTITLPADKLIGGLAGGPVVPEPGFGVVISGVLLAIGWVRLR